MPLRRFRQGPGYRGGVQLPANVCLSVGCAIYLFFSGVFLLLSGTIMTATATYDPFTTIGPVALSIGIILLLIAISMCIFFGYFAKKRQDRRHEQYEQSFNPEVPLQQPPPSAYQQTPQPVYPTVPSAPSQSSDQFSLEEKHPPQPESQPAYYCSSTSSYVPPSRYPYPTPPAYSELTPTPTYTGNLQPVISGYQPPLESTKN